MNFLLGGERAGRVKMLLTRLTFRLRLPGQTSEPSPPPAAETSCFTAGAQIICSL